MSSFRTVAPLLRTTARCLRAGPRASPLEFALRRQNAAGVLNFARGYAEKFTRDKPHVNIGKQLDALRSLWLPGSNLTLQAPLAMLITER